MPSEARILARIQARMLSEGAVSSTQERKATGKAKASGKSAKRPSKEGAASSVQERMRGRTERKANAAKAKAGENAATASTAAVLRQRIAEKEASEEAAATRMQAQVRGRASRKAGVPMTEQATKAYYKALVPHTSRRPGWSFFASKEPEQPKAPEQPKKKPSVASKDGGAHVTPSQTTPPKRSTCAPHVAEA